MARWRMENTEPLIVMEQKVDNAGNVMTTQVRIRQGEEVPPAIVTSGWLGSNYGCVTDLNAQEKLLFEQWKKNNVRQRYRWLHIEQGPMALKQAQMSQLEQDAAALEAAEPEV